MKVLNIVAKSFAEARPAVKRIIKKLPENVGLLSTIQHLEKLEDVKKYLEKNKKKAYICGQVLGCDASKALEVKDKVDAFLYIGSGKFHPIEILRKTKKKVFFADPLSNDAGEIDKEYVEKIEKRSKGALVKFLSSDDIGILVSLKPGQKRLKEAFKLKERILEKGKRAYIFVADNINLNECENFGFVKSWVNTACPRISEDKKGIVNYETVKEYI